MASLADVFTEEERTRWLKAWLAIDIAKSGLEQFAENEAVYVHADILKAVTNRIQPPPINRIRDEIEKRHRYGNGSWKNSSQNQFVSDPWEIAKCYFPVDGYYGIKSAHETDFNGIISFMLNCLHFNTKFSFPITTGKTNPPCLLTEVRTREKYIYNVILIYVQAPISICCRFDNRFIFNSRVEQQQRKIKYFGYSQNIHVLSHDSQSLFSNTSAAED
ncbi:hypothetical protein DPMN_164695 [Dreissena polymorpha]|uniref:Uncharacterized protein n=1 Tax=Dreissena polymorpha TaxID=45954 RepID=A0A9D4IWB6_DREPO|nr:hypothetical protein DPMN_164695 [Dreissena polymorpha]